MSKGRSLTPVVAFAGNCSHFWWFRVEGLDREALICSSPNVGFASRPRPGTRKPPEVRLISCFGFRESQQFSEAERNVMEQMLVATVFLVCLSRPALRNGVESERRKSW